MNLENNVLLTAEQFDELEKLSALNYTNEEIAMYFNVPCTDFIAQAENPGTPINFHLRRGILRCKASEQMGVMSSAESGNAQSLKVLSELRYRKDFNTARRDYIYNCEVDEQVYSRLESYIENGSIADLSKNEELYIEALTMLNGMRRKYGRAATIKFFCKPPFSLTYAKARDMYEHSINLFYVDSKIEKKALRNLKAQQIEDAADLLLRVAKQPADFELYGRLIKLSADILQLHLPDPPEVPAGTYDRPYKVYTLNPERIGIEKLDRNHLARQIDSIVGATESEKQHAKYDAGITDVTPLEQIMDEYEEENRPNK